MRLWTNATLGVAAVVACAGGAVAQTAGGCASCGGAASLKPAVPNTIPHCSKHTGLTQYPLSDKRYIKQFCNPTICPNSCFGHFKTQWTAWPQACPGWPTEGVDPANYGPNFTRYEPPVTPEAKTPATPPAAAPEPKSGTAPEPKPADTTPPSKPFDLPPSKPAAPPTAPKTPGLGLDVPALPMPAIPPAPGGKF